jgi:hypothetical protein
MVNLSSTAQSRKRPGSRQRRPDLSVLRRRQLQRFGKYAAKNLNPCLVAWHWHNKRSSKDPAWALVEAARRMGGKVTEAQAQQIIEEAAATFHPMHMSADGLARYVGLPYSDRTRLKITVIGACDVSKQERADLRRQRDRAYQEQKRRERGARPQTQSLSQTRPWEAEKISRRTWERRRKNARVATSSAAILINADDEIASKPIKPTKRAASLRSAASALLGGISAQTRPALRAARLFAADGVNPGSVWRPASSAPTTGSARPPSPKADRWRREDADDDEAVLERYAAAANGGIR